MRTLTTHFNHDKTLAYVEVVEYTDPLKLITTIRGIVEQHIAHHSEQKIGDENKC